MLDGLDNASIEIKEAKVCLMSYIWLFVLCDRKFGNMVVDACSRIITFDLFLLIQFPCALKYMI